MTNAILAAVVAISMQQSDSTRVVRGVVTDMAGRPVGAANVFIKTTLEGAVTCADGRFSFRTSARPPMAVLVTAEGYNTNELSLYTTQDSLLIRLAAVLQLAPLTVEAGRYTAGRERGATLTTLEVATTPGATADIGRTAQSLPGVQLVDEGNAIFVRGGDASETRILVNGALVPSPVRLETPTGNFAGTVNAFLLDGIFFSTGGFGARYGNALSGILSLNTLGSPARHEVTGSVGLGALSGGGALRLSPSSWLRGTATLFSTAPVFYLNGSSRKYNAPPHGADISMSAGARALAGDVKLFVIDQRSRFALGVDEPSYQGNYALDHSSTFGVLTWDRTRGSAASAIVLAFARDSQEEGFSAFHLNSTLDVYQLGVNQGWSPAPRITLRGGADLERSRGHFLGNIPLNAYDRDQDAQAEVIRSESWSTRVGLYGEAELRPLSRWRLTPGLRSDHSNATTQRTWDPRLSIAFQPSDAFTFTAAGGVFHQVPDALQAQRAGGVSVPAMRSEQIMAGGQFTRGAAIVRVELYSKRYHDLVQFTRDEGVHTAGTGNSRGADVFGRITLGRSNVRVAYSLVESQRTDPNTEILAPAPFDVTHTLTWIAERSFGHNIRVGSAVRVATGRPYTEVVSAQYDALQRVYVPRYGAPNAQRLPRFFRIDVSGSKVFPLQDRGLLVVFASVNNLTDRENIYSYRYNADYSQRIPVRSLFKRSFYFGASITRS
jgi:hypothetical protein